MRRRRRHRRSSKRILILSAAAVCITAAGYKSLPGIAATAGRLGEIKITFENEPDNYTGENDFNFQSILGEEDIISSGYGWSEEEMNEDSAVDASGEIGPKPYPSKWNTGDGSVYKYTFERYSGEKYIGLEGGGQVRNETDISNAALLEESKNLPDFQIELNDKPQVLIMHTHTTESFEPFERENFDSSFNYRTTESSKNVVMIGNEITKQIENAGISVIHDTTIHDYPSYNGSYERSAETVKKILRDNPSIKVVLDIHRDAIGTNESIMQPTVEINGKDAAPIMIISGCDDGTMDMPDYMKNFRFASLLQQQISSDYQGLARPILFDYRKYNQDLTTGSLLIEVGTHGNTLEQVKYTGELLGKSIAKSLINISEEK